MNNEFISKLNDIAEQVNLYIDKNVVSKDNLQKVVYEAMRYSLLAGGKRIRPVLAIESAAVLGLDAEKVMPFACAIEMIHTYSLIHDDLPAMDNDDFRRGRPSCHKQFDEATAILAGDALLTMAFEIASKGAIEAENIRGGIEAVKHIAYCAGTEGMIGGQIVDLDAETRKISEEELIYLCERKTGALLRVPVLVAAAVAGKENTSEAECLLEYADTVGLAFQIKDDILDVEGDINVLGKPIGSDKQEGKTTFVTLHGIEGSKKILRELTDKAFKACDRMREFCKTEKQKDACDFLRELAVFLLERNY